jgi:hypothetical protein
VCVTCSRGKHEHLRALPCPCQTLPVMSSGNGGSVADASRRRDNTEHERGLERVEKVANGSRGLPTNLIGLRRAMERERGTQLPCEP